MMTVITLKVMVTHVREGKGGRGVIMINIAGGRGVGGGGGRDSDHYWGAIALRPSADRGRGWGGGAL